MDGEAGTTVADRSTAAVDVADDSGEEPLTAREGEATGDGVEAHDTADAVSEADTGTAGTPDADHDDRGAARGVEPLDLHSGHKLAGRYRLEECLTRLDGFSSWRAVDEKLRRAVGVHLLPAAHSRARPVLAAARSAALLGDPRFVQVLDAVEEGNLVYVVHEWLPDATELTTILASGPFEPHEAYQLVSQVSQAMAAAHSEGLAHLRLTPGCVLRTESGQYRIRGLAVMAALRGIRSEHPKRTDTESIGALLYAALTQRWPYENDAFGLSGLPKGVGLIAPDQVRAGVHRGLAEIAIRALANDGATPSRLVPPCTTPEELAKAVTTLPRIRPPEPSFATPTYQAPAYRQSYSRSAARTSSGAGSPAPAPPPPPLQSRTGKALKWTVSALLIAALGLGSWQLADTLMNRETRSQDSDLSRPTGGDAEADRPGPPLGITQVREFSPLGAPVTGGMVGRAVDGREDTAWVTPQYKGFANFGNLPNRKDGSGIIIDLGEVKKVSGLQLDMYREGHTLELLAAPPSAVNPASLQEFSERLTDSARTGGKVSATLDKPVRTRYLLVHITELPADGSAALFRGGIAEVKITG